MSNNNWGFSGIETVCFLCIGIEFLNNICMNFKLQRAELQIDSYLIL
jgi:hypothetical protein